MIDPNALVKGCLQEELDDWTRRVVRRHFDPDIGSPYWLARAAELDFDPRDITRYAELAAFGPLSLQELRERDPAELVPMAVPRPLVGRVWDSGGTTGDPCRVFYTESMIVHRAAWRHWSFRTEGFLPGRGWLQATPTGPHLIGNGAYELTEFFDARVYLFDADPRWAKRLIRMGRFAEAEEYTAHLIEQIAGILRTQPVSYMNTTPALLAALIRKEPELAAALEGVRLSGTHITAAMHRAFAKVLGGGICGRSYGNTFGNCAGLPADRDGAVLPYLPNYPQVTAAVVSRSDWTKPVGYGQIGQVRLTVMHEDLFLPNVLERDQAMRYDTGPEWPCDGVANVLPLQISRATPEGFY
ncbi:hypothetical protein Drose_26815 [Dactylosporangium roseum]|uniref:Arylcarboxylate reductase n=1 Tax=Dactylosporangium roseum TaxID=47989 RepID=A0ABY5YZ38_9ACTN|nr:hypothetical protein [Dactylosporangium roseum]UWZ34787.1 hypothetical protein Drose_26815 [Dactylosporangium roseum]